MCQRVLGLERQRFLQNRDRLLVLMALFEHGAQIVPSGDESWLLVHDPLENFLCVLIAVSHHRQPCQQQCRVDVVRVFTDQLLSQLFRLSELSFDKKSRGFIQLGLRRRQ